MGLHFVTSASPDLLMQQQHYHHLHGYQLRDGCDGSGNTGHAVARKVWFSLLLWALGIASVLLLSISYSPNPFATAPLADTAGPGSLPAAPDHHEFARTSSSSAEDVEVKPCELSVGKWVRDEVETRAANNYTNRSYSRTLPESLNTSCSGDDTDHAAAKWNWRWKPDGCELPGFNPRRFLSTVRGKRLAFVGDFLARNQMESLRCLLSQVETPVDVQRDADERFREWYYPSHGFTLMMMSTRFLLVTGQGRIHDNGSAASAGTFDIHLDRVDVFWAGRLEGLDYVVISSGPWAFRELYLYEGGNLAGCVSCSDPNLQDLGIVYAIRRALRTALRHISGCIKCDKLHTILGTSSPTSSDQDGSWNGGGHYCNNHTLPLDDRGLGPGGTRWELIRSAQVEELSRVTREQVNNVGRPTFGALDVTMAMLMWTDGVPRPSPHRGDNTERMEGYSTDHCLQYWRLPGGPMGMWNDMLLALILGGLHTSHGR